MAFFVLRPLGSNGIFVATGVFAPRPTRSDAKRLMRNIVLKDQVLPGSLDAERCGTENLRPIGGAK